MRAKNGLNCPDSVLPDTWETQAARATLEALDLDDLDRELAALKAR
jgi:hypothetical protein